MAFIKDRIYKGILKRKMNAHRPSKAVFNLYQSHYVGILFDANSQESIDTVMAFRDQLTRDGKQVYLLGYFNKEYKSGDHAFPFYSRNCLNWYEIPNDKTVDDFTRRNFDILINLYQVKYKALEYVSVLSNAKFRIGKYFNNADLPTSDMSIQSNESLSAMAFLDQLNNFLKSINNNVEAV